ncbi:GNAT family N-acetyltransferase [Aureibacillus halotolerans]|uniref:GNAT family acetyltransferase n=1 Tax=Aureibacillus halotolerans TaxID=1508390 RepID=A0A4R6UAE9_9BACI|nr:GNAT family N-acetyltransferase [Aureibacillus halotolerans]TDQ42826.1 GNAT family acetyltransferase [Aureibacillus halotolerans]
MTEHYTIYQATIQDLNDLVPLFDLYRVFYEQSSDIEGARDFLFRRFDHAESIIFIAKTVSEGQAIGFAQLYPTFSSISMQRSWVLNDLYVREDHRSQGVASLLLDQVRAFSVNTKAKGVALSTSLDNTKAQALYEKCGFVKDNEFYHYFLNVSKSANEQ